MDAQLFINSVVFVFLMVRFAGSMLSRSGCWKLALFLLVVMLTNFKLMSENFDIQVAVYKAAMITLGFLVGVAVMAYAKKKGRTER